MRKQLGVLVALAATASLAQEQQVGQGSPAVNAPGGLQSAAAVPQHAIEISAYAILSGAWTQADPTLLSVGRNNGFALGDARIELTGRPTDSLWLYLSIDGAAPLRGSDPVIGRRGVELRDAYGVWAPGGHVRLQGGQFKAPQGVEELLEETELKFVRRSIVSEGAGAPFSYDAQGFALGRQLGLAVGTDKIDTRFGFITAQAAIMNGNGDNQLLNDTPYPSFAGRAAVAFGSFQVGVNASFVPRGSGSQPSYFRDNLLGAGLDVRLEKGALHMLTLVQARSTRHVTSGAPAELGFGGSMEWAYRFGFLEPAVRVAYMDPSDAIKTDAIANATLGVNLYAPNAPALFRLNLVHRIEDGARSLDNDGVELAAQVRF